VVAVFKVFYYPNDQFFIGIMAVTEKDLLSFLLFLFYGKTMPTVIPIILIFGFKIPEVGRFDFEAVDFHNLLFFLSA